MSKKGLVCKNATKLAYYRSYSLLVMGSCLASINKPWSPRILAKKEEITKRIKTARDGSVTVNRFLSSQFFQLRNFYLSIWRNFYRTSDVALAKCLKYPWLLCSVWCSIWTFCAQVIKLQKPRPSRPAFAHFGWVLSVNWLWTFRLKSQVSRSRKESVDGSAACNLQLSVKFSAIC